MPSLENYSEFDGAGVMPNTVFPKGTDALTADDKLRLQSITGQETDSRAQVDPFFWQGNIRPDPADDLILAQERRMKRQEIVREELDRYKETPQY